VDNFHGIFVIQVTGWLGWWNGTKLELISHVDFLSSEKHTVSK
jgi:hypothetical protein